MVDIKLTPNCIEDPKNVEQSCSLVHLCASSQEVTNALSNTHFKRKHEYPMTFYIVQQLQVLCFQCLGKVHIFEYLLSIV